MKMPPQKAGNGYYGFENQAENQGTGPLPVVDGPAADGPGPQQNPAAGGGVVAPEDEFSEYLWMENEEEFDKQVLQQLEEEELMEQCMEAMLDEHNALADERTHRANSQCSQASDGSEILSLVNNFRLDLVDVAKSTLNPLAAEFIPDTVANRIPVSRND